MNGARTASLLAAAATPWLPLWAVATSMHPRTRGDWHERWGVTTAPVAPGVVWIHAASVGEVGGAEALALVIPDRVLITADTDTGVAVARQIAARSGGRILAMARPVDHPWTLAPLWAEARPRAVAFVEGTWWTQLARLATRDGVPVFRVSAKVGGRSALAHQLGLRRPLEAAATVLARSEPDRAVLGGQVTGDLKADRPAPQPLLRWPRAFVVGASTHAPEEEALLDALPTLPGSPALLLAPRRIERVPGLSMVMEARGVPWVLRSQLQQDVPPGVDVVLLDTLGELARGLVGAQAAFVGGSFDPAIGGHSAAEAHAAGVPTVAGPERSSNAQSHARSVLAQHPSELGAALAQAMGSGQPTRSGAAARTWAAIQPRLGQLPRQRSPRPWLRPAAGLWRAGSAVRNGLYDVGVRRGHDVGVPVLSVGSTNARGPGKTSTVAWLVRQLQQRGHVVGVATRGYRRTRPGRDTRLAHAAGRAEDLGDEGAWLQLVTGAMVAAGPDRVAAARILAKQGCTVVVLDDGLQHRRLHRDLDLAVIDGRSVGAGGSIPAGWRRESPPVPARVHGVIVHHGWPMTRPWHQTTVFAERVPGPWHHRDKLVIAPTGPVYAFAGTARPGDFLASLTDLDVQGFRALGDHQPVTADLADELMRAAAGRPLVCTGKDLVRLPRALRPHVWWRDVELHIADVPDHWLEIAH